MAVHAIGDRANREALDAFAATRGEWQPLGLRQRIEHAQRLAPEDVGRFAEIGVACSVQFSHALRPTADFVLERFGLTAPSSRMPTAPCSTRAPRSRTARRPGRRARPASAGIAAGVLRTIDERPGWHPEQAVTIEQALHASTAAPAWPAGDEHRRGKLLPGFLADLVVLDRPAARSRAGGIAQLEVVATMVGGR